MSRLLINLTQLWLSLVQLSPSLFILSAATKQWRWRKEVQAKLILAKLSRYWILLHFFCVTLFHNLFNRLKKQISSENKMSDNKSLIRKEGWMFYEIINNFSLMIFENLSPNLYATQSKSLHIDKLFPNPWHFGETFPQYLSGNFVRYSPQKTKCSSRRLKVSSEKINFSSMRINSIQKNRNLLQWE